MFDKLRHLSKSIILKTMLSHALIALVATAIAAIVAYTLSRGMIGTTLMRELDRQADFLVQTYDCDSDNMEFPDAGTIESYHRLTDSYVYYFDTDYVAMQIGNSADIVPSESTADKSSIQELYYTGIINSPDLEVAERILGGESISMTQRMEFASDEIIFAARPLYNSAGNIVGGVIVAHPFSVFSDLSSAALAMLLWAAGISLFIGFGLSIELSRKLTRPIKQLTLEAKLMSEGSSHELLRIDRRDELGQLGSSFNRLTNRLDDVSDSLREERDRADLVIKSIGEGILAVDSFLNIIRHNSVFLELLEAESPEGALADDCTSAGPLKELLTEVIRDSKRAKACWKNASDRDIEAVVSPYFDRNGEAAGAVALVRDVSEALRLEKMRRDYIANISHELRTPLTGIRGMVEPLIDGYIDTEAEKQACYQVIYQETIRLEKLVGELLDISRLQDGRVSIDLEPMELPGIIDAAVRRMQPLADSSGITLSGETDGSALRCMGNEDRILQVLIILMDNALSFTPSGGRVAVSGRDDGTQVVLSVRDSGVGISKKDLPFIWDRFYKVDKSRMRTVGTGLGLAIAKLIVERMGGEIYVDSAPGFGSTFSFTLNKYKTEE